MKKKKIFIESTGSLVSESLISQLQKTSSYVVSSDITEWNTGANLSNKYIKIQSYKNPNLWKTLIRILKKLGSNFKKTLFVGDHKDNDIIGAKAIGMKTLWVNHLKINCNKSDFVVYNPTNTSKKICN